MAQELKLATAPGGHSVPAATRRTAPRRLGRLARPRLSAALGVLAAAFVAAYAVEVVNDTRGEIAGPSQAQMVQATAEDALHLFLMRRWSELAPLYAPGSTFKEAVNGVRRTGATAIIARLKAWHAHYPGLTGKTMSTAVNGDTVTFHMSWRGRLGSPARSGRTLIPRGTVVTLNSLVLIVVRDGKIVETEHSFNRDELARPAHPIGHAG